MTEIKDQILKEFEEKFATAGQDEDGNFTMVHFDLYDYKEFISKSLDKIEQATIQKVIDSLPKEETRSTENSYLFYSGYNLCRQEILDKLKGLQDE